MTRRILVTASTIAFALLVSVMPARADLMITSFWTHEIYRYKNDGTFLGVFVPQYYGGAYRPVALEWGNLGLYVVNDGGDDVVTYNPVSGAQQGVSFRETV
ncbi:MAG: hypothetical protein JRH17_25265 [Deltaproteobacteria bacterium]|nr:hypothetical protein [Deltaproteobacteria bacterium]